MPRPQLVTPRDSLTPPRPASPRARWAGVAVGLVVVAGLIVVRLASPGETNSAAALGTALQDFLALSVSVVIESLPFVVLGIVISVVVRHWLPEGLIFRLLPRNPLGRRVVLSLLGVLLPVCECGNVPLARGLIMQGISVPETMTFLLAAPIVNPITIVTTFQAFGWNDGILPARVIGGFLVANLVGWLYSRHPDPMSMLTPRFEATCRVGHDHDHDHGTRWQRSVRSFAEETATMLPALFIGSAVAGLIQVAVSRQLLVALGSNPVWSVLVLMLLAFVVAMCSNVDAFFILSLGSTFLPGAIVAFLVFGPMIDVKMLALLRTTFRTRTLAVLTAVVALGAAVIGLGMNLVA